MRIHMICIGQRPPEWVTLGFKEYVQRLPHGCSLHLVEIATPKRGRNADLDRLRREEGAAMMAAIPTDCLKVAMDLSGASWDSVGLSRRLSDWMHSGRDVALLIGGPDGLTQECLDHADLKWSLSDLTLPHALVRVVIAEQLYRAWSILQGHPYHR